MFLLVQLRDYSSRLPTFNTLIFVRVTLTSKSSMKEIWIKGRQILPILTLSRLNSVFARKSATSLMRKALLIIKYACQLSQNRLVVQIFQTTIKNINEVNVCRIIYGSTKINWTNWQVKFYTVSFWIEVFVQKISSLSSTSSIVLGIGWEENRVWNELWKCFANKN